jgi:hypothetical protein
MAGLQGSLDTQSCSGNKRSRISKGCQIFLATKKQKGTKYTQKCTKITIGHKNTKINTK